MTKKQERDQKIAGISGILVLVFVLALFVLFLDMLDNMLEYLQTEMSVDEFGSKILLFLGLLLGIIGFSWISMQYMPKKKRG